MRPVAAHDAPELHALWTASGVRRFLWDGAIIPRARTVEAIATSERLFGERRYGLWIARKVDTRHLVGFAGLWPFRDPPEIELLYGTAESNWGQGYAPETGRAIVDYCFTTLGMPVIAASTDAANSASIRVLDKLGFHLTRRLEVGGLDTVFFEMRRPAG
jgi:ribosomal-protein-alanine N-acetyltransferase